MGSSEEDLSRMRTFCFSLLPIFLLPFTSCSGQHIATSRDGRQFLLKANDNENEEASPIFRNRRLSSLPSCRRGVHGAPCTTGKNEKYAGRCCRGECWKLRDWIRYNCPKPVKDERHRLVAVKTV